MSAEPKINSNQMFEVIPNPPNGFDYLVNVNGFTDIDFYLKPGLLINEAKEKERRICAVGTTVVKALESSLYPNGKIKPFDGWTNRFIFPPHQVTSTDALITNFHPSESPMLMIAAAFGGYDFVMKAYKEAIKEKYRFYSYGDAMLII